MPPGHINEIVEICCWLFSVCCRQLLCAPLSGQAIFKTPSVNFLMVIHKGRTHSHSKCFNAHTLLSSPLRVSLCALKFRFSLFACTVFAFGGRCIQFLCGLKLFFLPSPVVANDDKKIKLFFFFINQLTGAMFDNLWIYATQSWSKKKTRRINWNVQLTMKC